MTNRRRFLKSVATGLFVPAFPAIVKAQSIQAWFSACANQKQGAGGSDPLSWYDLQASPGDSSDATNSTTLFWTAITPNLTGTCTKLRIWCVSNALGNVKMGLWDNAKHQMGSGGANGTSAVAGAGAYTEVTLGTSVSIVSGTQYLIGWISDDSPNWGYLNGSSGVSLQFNNTGTYTYANFPNGDLPADNPVTNRKHCVSMFI